MKTFLAVVGLLAWLAAFGVLIAAKSAVHEIEAAILGVLGTVAFAGYAIIGELIAFRAEQKKAAEDAALVHRNFFSDVRAKFDIK